MNTTSQCGCTSCTCTDCNCTNGCTCCDTGICTCNNCKCEDSCITSQPDNIKKGCPHCNKS